MKPRLPTPACLHAPLDQRFPLALGLLKIESRHSTKRRYRWETERKFSALCEFWDHSGAAPAQALA